MLSSSKIVDKSYSVLSNDDIWKGEEIHEDSKNFIENFKKINDKKTNKINREIHINNNDHLEIINQMTNKVTLDYFIKNILEFIICVFKNEG